MGKVFLVYLDGRIYSCRFCNSHLANMDDVVSRVCTFCIPRERDGIISLTFSIFNMRDDCRICVYEMEIVCISGTSMIVSSGFNFNTNVF